ncbi:hypothetical protein [Schumannella sp. 10F1B-5-1]|uniref:hypothetical protein n=1 Tax=Schumannella sp. 10F1B-5-1 TaxID=2590780 RepID=UPI001131624F|nr:hypothetical protein [Schumannella sp. 10F1B-5-1]TPW78398.1 hypothetical protein FJ658_00905 [Schumannella sp. 10F1B-5-1]
MLSTALAAAIDRIDTDTLLRSVVPEMSDEQLGAAAEALLDAAVPHGADEGAYLPELLRRLGRSVEEVDSSMILQALNRAFRVPELIIHEPASTATVAVNEAKVLNEAEKNDRAARILELSTRASDIADVRADVAEHSEVFGAIQQFLLEVGELDEKTLLNQHDEVFNGGVPNIAPEHQLRLALVAIARRPSGAAWRWISTVERLAGVTADTELTENAIETVARRFVGGFAADVRANALSNYRHLKLVATPTPVSHSGVLSILDMHVAGADSEWDASMLSDTADFLDAGESAEPGIGFSALQATLVLNILESGAEDAQTDGLLAISERAAAPAEFSLALKSNVEMSIEANPLLGRMIARADAAASAISNKPHASLTADEVTVLTEYEPSIADTWARSGPTADEIIAVADESDILVSTAALRTWAQRVSVEERSQLWFHFANVDALQRARASAGDEITISSSRPFMTQLSNASNAASRSALADRLRTIPPRTAGLKAVLIDAIDLLSTRGANQDLAVAAQLALSLPTLSGPERGRMQRLFGDWIERDSRVLSKQRVAELRDQGLLAKQRTTSFLDTVFGRKKR